MWPVQGLVYAYPVAPRPSQTELVAERLADLVAASMHEVGAHVESDLLGTTQVGAVARAVDEACAALGPVVDARFYQAGVGLVAGVVLGDGREVVVKDLARLAHRRQRPDAGPSVIGHFDWRTQNLAFDGTHVVAIYDWDSLAIAPEPVVVGAAAGQFTIDWTAGDADPPPTVDEMRAFVADYEDARGSAFSRDERELLDAANLGLIAYGARTQHSDNVLRPDLGDSTGVGWLRLLRERGERALVV